MITVALILALLTWSTPRPTIWVCMPGHSPVGSAPSTCEQLHFSVLGKFRVP